MDKSKALGALKQLKVDYRNMGLMIDDLDSAVQDASSADDLSNTIDEIFKRYGIPSA